MASLFQRFRGYRRRKRAAAKLGFSFHRSRDFRAPSCIRLLGKEHDLHLPDDHGTRVAFLDILLDDCYALRDLPKNVGSVLDIGAHAGLFSLAARVRFPDATIHAYEPNPEMQRFLAQQSEAARFSVFPEAVGLESGRVSIKPGQDSVHTKIVQDPQSDIPCISFSEAIGRIRKEPILVKLDCEGCEWEILCDADAWQRVESLTMEYHLWAGYTLIELKKRIESLGFSIKYLSDTEDKFGILTARRA